MEDKRIVVTGGAGFIGCHLAEALSPGNSVIIIDNLSTGRMENIETFAKGDGIRFIEGSINDLPLLRKVFQGIDYVFHEAALPSVPRSIDNPLAAHEANITGTLNVLVAAKERNVKKVIFASSSSIYGDAPTSPKREDMPPRPRSPYAVTKLAGEQYCLVFQQIYGLATVCLRYFNVYGPKQDPGSQYAAVIPLFIKRISEGMPPIIFGDGNQTRDFTFVEDIVRANILAAESDAAGIFNVGGGKAISINDLARLVMKLSGINLQPIHQPTRTGDVRDSLADITKAKAFGYIPRYDLEQGLRKLLLCLPKEKTTNAEIRKENP